MIAQLSPLDGDFCYKMYILLLTGLFLFNDSFNSSL